jgi:hypothetical protein
MSTYCKHDCNQVSQRAAIKELKTVRKLLGICVLTFTLIYLLKKKKNCTFSCSNFVQRKRKLRKRKKSNLTETSDLTLLLYKTID